MKTKERQRAYAEGDGTLNGNWLGVGLGRASQVGNQFCGCVKLTNGDGIRVQVFS